MQAILLKLKLNRRKDNASNTTEAKTRKAESMLNKRNAANSHG